MRHSRDHSLRSRPLIWLATGALLGFAAHPLLQRNPNSAQSPSVTEGLQENPRRLAASEGSRKPTLASRANKPAVKAAEPVPAHEGLLGLLTRIAHLTLSECESSFLECEKLEGDERNIAFHALSLRWSALDPRDAIRFAETLDARRVDEKRVWIRAAAEELGKRDPESLLGLIDAARSPLSRILLAESGLPALAKTNPASVAQYLAGHPELRHLGEVYQRVAEEFGRVAPIDALAWADSIPAYRLRAQVSKQVWSTWARTDPASAAAALRERGAKVDHDVYEVLSRTWSTKDPLAARDWIQSLQNRGLQERAWQHFVVDPGQIGTDVAHDLVQSITSPSGQAVVAGRVAAEMARNDVAGALTWAENLSQGTSRTEALRSVLDAWSGTDPAAAMAYAVGLPANQFRTDQIKRTVATWGQQNPEAALLWTQSLEPGPLKDGATAEALQMAVRVDPSRTGTWLDLIQGSSIPLHSANQIVNEWAAVDGAAASQWATGLPSVGQADAFYSVIRGWAFGEPEAAGEWIESLTPGAGRDSAIKAYVSVIDGMDAGLATRWATAIEQPNDRNEAVTAAFNRWAVENRSAAEEWLQSAQLSQDLQTQLSQQISQQENRDGP